MKRSLSFSALTVLAVCWCVAGAEPAPPRAGPAPPPDAQDFVYFADSRPVLVRVHVFVDGKPLRQAWEAYIDQVFKYLDVNGDGVLSKEEAERTPPPQTLFNAGFFGGRVPPASSANLGANRDGKVTRQQLADYYRKNGAAPFQFQAGGGDAMTQYRLVGLAQVSTPSADVLNQTLFDLLDTNKDGKLSRAELAAAEKLLRKLDADDDEMISVQELVPGPAPTGNEFVVVRSGGFVASPGSTGAFLMLGPGESRANLARQLLQRYGPKGKKPMGRKLTQKDLGLDKETFDRLDADGDGELDAEELARFADRPADLELTARLGQRGAGLPVVALAKRKEGPGPLAANVRKTGAGSLVLDLGNSRVELGSADRGGGVAFAFNIRDQYIAQFKAADRDNNGYLDMDEARQSPFFRNTFKLMDRDGDGKLFEKEMLAYLDQMEALQNGARNSCVSMTLSDQGRGLFDLVDTDHDGRLSVRELRQMVKLVDQLDRDGDGQISRNEIPRSYRLDFRKGPANDQFNGRVFAVPVNGRAMGRGQPAPARTRGPLWFRKMDRNRDGDVSRREFLGSDELFRKIDTDGDGLISVEEAERYDELMRKDKGPARRPGPPPTREPRR
jgi:Ca2+-binding EF-hand superfamily protein